MEDKNQIWDFIMDYGLATREEIMLVVSINGYSIETLNSIIFSRSAYRDMEQFLTYNTES
jgi:hypothetical protein